METAVSGSKMIVSRTETVVSESQTGISGSQARVGVATFRIGVVHRDASTAHWMMRSPHSANDYQDRAQGDPCTQMHTHAAGGPRMCEERI